MNWTEMHATATAGYIMAGLAGHTKDKRPISISVSRDGSHIALQVARSQVAYIVDNLDLIDDLRKSIQGEPE